MLDVNELTSENLTVGQSIFLPGVGLDKKTLQSKMGELFIIPIKSKPLFNTIFKNFYVSILTYITYINNHFPSIYIKK